MKTIDAQRVISQHRGDAVVVATMSAIFEWPLVSKKPELDLTFSVMSKASSLALGLALGRPDKQIMVLDGDGSLLMNVGTLVTIANAKASNLVYFLVDNGCYRCCPPADNVPGYGTTDFCGLAKASGFTEVYAFDNESDLNRGLPSILNKAGPVFIWLKCANEKTFPEGTYIEPGSLVDNFVKTFASA